MYSDIEKLKEELIEMQRSHLEQWETYGSELCSGHMFELENNLKKKIERLEREKNAAE